MDLSAQQVAAIGRRGCGVVSQARSCEGGLRSARCVRDFGGDDGEDMINGVEGILIRFQLVRIDIVLFQKFWVARYR